MKRQTVVMLLAGLVCVSGCQKPPKPSGPSASKTRLAESIVWMTASKTVLPDYPQASIQRGISGLSVAFLLADTDGRVKEIEILEAPDQPIGAAVRTALEQWAFTPLTVEGSDQRLRIQGKVTFYFDLRNGVPVVQGSRDRIADRVKSGLYVPPVRPGTPATR